tara:strand:+ start:784 stop:1398 length:615 start_codon:yes stop_codon:yes gene_type:complete
MDEEWANLLEDRYDFLAPRNSRDCLAFDCPTDYLLELFKSLRDKEGCDLLMDVTAVDWGENATPRFSTLYHFFSLARKTYLRIACDCQDDLQPSMPSVSKLYPAADWHEREVFDMFGIHFIGHPNLKRILMWDDYPHFPLRKDFPLAGIETKFPAADVAEDTGVSVQAAPMMGGPFVAPAEGHVSKSEPRGKDQSWTEECDKPR